MARRGSLGGKVNTIAGLLLFAGAAIAAWWLYGKVRGGQAEQILSGIGGAIMGGGSGTTTPIAGGQFGPSSSPIAAAPAVTAAASSGAGTRPPMWTAAELSREPAGGWTAPPLFQQIAPDVVRDVSGGKIGGVNPANRLVGFSHPTTGEFRLTPFAGASAIWA